MATSVEQIFSEVNVKIQGQLKLGTNFTDINAGVYVVAARQTSIIPDFDRIILKLWIDKLSMFLIDGKSPTMELLKERFLEFWLSGETILYVGKASKTKRGGISNRVQAY